MTLTNELGINELFQIFPENILDTTLNYIENNKISLMQFIGILSLLEHTHNKYQECYPKLKQYLKINLLKNIYTELENIKPIFTNIEKISPENIQELLESNLSKDLINQVAYTEMITLKQSFSHSGLYYLFHLLLELDLSNFENWIKNTQRLDFKIIFLNTILGDYTNSDIILDNLDNAQLGIVQAFYSLRRFQIDKMCRNVYCKNEDINLLFKSNLPARSKFIIYLQYITTKYHGLNLKELQEHKDFDNDIDMFKEINYNFTEKELFDFINIYYSIIGFKIIQKIHNEEKKQLFLEKLQNKLLDYLSKERFIDLNIDYANLLGFISIELNYCQNLETIFNKKYKELSFPYSYCKVKNWEEQVIYMFYLLIGLYIYKKNNKEEFITYINKLKFTIGDVTSYALRDLNIYIEQMK